MQQQQQSQVFTVLPAPPQQGGGTRIAFRHYQEVTTRRLLGGVQSGLEQHVEWALSALLVKTFHGEVLLEHAPGLAPALVDLVAAEDREGGCCEEVRALQRLLLVPRACRKQRVLTVLHNLAHIPQNAAEMASTRIVAEFLFGELSGGGDDGDVWRIALDTLASLAPFMLLAAGRGPWIARLFALLASSDTSAAAGALRVLAALSSSAANGVHFAATPEADCRCVAERALLAPPQLHDAAVRLLHNLCSFSPLACRTAAATPGVVRMLVTTLALAADAVAATTATADGRLAACIDRGRFAGQTLLLLAHEPSVPRSAFTAFEPYLVTLAASESPLATAAATVLAELLPNPT